MSDLRVRLNSDDAALLDQAKAAGATVVTHDKALGADDGALIRLSAEDICALRASLRQRLAEIDECYPALIEGADPDVVNAIAAMVLGAVRDQIRAPGSFRHLIYDRLGVSPSGYVPLCVAGGLDVTNFIVSANKLACAAKTAIERNSISDPGLQEQLTTALESLAERYS